MCLCLSPRIPEWAGDESPARDLPERHAALRPTTGPAELQLHGPLLTPDPRRPSRPLPPVEGLLRGRAEGRDPRRSDHEELDSERQTQAV